MNIKAEVVADSIGIYGDRLTSLLITFPRIILAEINTHRMLSKNTSSSRAIPFNKMVEAVQNNPFIPIAWQKHHSGMQGTEYITDEHILKLKKGMWLNARNKAVQSAEELYGNVSRARSMSDVQELKETGVTKQLANRLLEPFMWTTMLITGSKEGWDNFFNLRCPQYQDDTKGFEHIYYKSISEWYKNTRKLGSILPSFEEMLYKGLNKGQAEIHIMDLAEKIYDAMNRSTPKQLGAKEWHIPFEKKINDIVFKQIVNTPVIKYDKSENVSETKVKISCAMAARTSYTVVEDEKEIDYQKMIDLHDRLIEMRHDSPLEHCARAMNDEEYQSFFKGKLEILNEDRDFEDNIEIMEPHHSEKGWCKNFKGFRSYRQILEEC